MYFRKHVFKEENSKYFVNTCHQWSPTEQSRERGKILEQPTANTMFLKIETVCMKKKAKITVFCQKNP